MSCNFIPYQVMFQLLHKSTIPWVDVQTLTKKCWPAKETEFHVLVLHCCFALFACCFI